jgi:biotin-(acetyl-CoA carboxylase) ligase
MFDDTIEGFAEEVELDGSLRLRLADGSVYQVIAGDVAFDPAKP